MNNFASYCYAEMLVLAVKKKKSFILTKNKEKTETVFLMNRPPSWYKWHSKVAQDFAQSFA